jgi:hypothetical protein
VQSQIENYRAKAKEFARLTVVAKSLRHSDSKPRYQSECLRCEETMFLPEWSGYLDRYRIQHLWECEACGHRFKTLVSLSHS